MLDVLIGLALAALGFYFGRKSVPKKHEPPKAEEQELQRMQEDRAAFMQLMGYNADLAYGEGGNTRGI